jgi:hypothetical protein
MKVGIMQPTFFPWVGFFELINATDRFVFLDSVELSKQSWQTRNVFKQSNGLGWQSIPVSGSSQSVISNSEINNFRRFIGKLSRTVLQAHSKSQHVEIISDFFNGIDNERFNTVADFNIYTIKYFSKLLSIKTEFLKSSDMCVQGEKDGLIIEILKKSDCDTYIASPGSRSYMEIFGIHNYPITVDFFNYSKSMDASYFYDGYGYENIMDVLARTGIKEVMNNVL